MSHVSHVTGRLTDDGEGEDENEVNVEILPVSQVRLVLCTHTHTHTHTDFSQDWRTIIWKTNLNQALHTQAY